ncbi:MAG: molecular chaperone [Lachnospiraceae bacterium]|nr:molecular chaperone [Butyrivibrio sp.]MCM1342429.1 hypothetical protein [Muribaculaceae bacterium]MCM1410264.1 molecular chaperone [Lachnospiraceae bacterium]
METNRTEQLEALETLSQFNDRLLKNLPTIISELSGKRQPDTDTYLKSILDAINWEINVMNATSDLLAEGETPIDKENFNQSILALNAALSSETDSEISDAFRNLIPHFEALGAAAKEVTA